ncbi:MAG: hypothetical protein FWE42_00945 [Defluviitaleaceae bacterium]|nr:hypothetical protein [Defluviitaleaceae bacterium]
MEKIKLTDKEIGEITLHEAAYVYANHGISIRIEDGKPVYAQKEGGVPLWCWCITWGIQIAAIIISIAAITMAAINA